MIKSKCLGNEGGRCGERKVRGGGVGRGRGYFNMSEQGKTRIRKLRRTPGRLPTGKWSIKTLGSIRMGSPGRNLTNSVVLGPTDGSFVLANL